jgi:hypothetical protein
MCCFVGSCYNFLKLLPLFAIADPDCSKYFNFLVKIFLSALLVLLFAITVEGGPRK